MLLTQVKFEFGVCIRVDNFDRFRLFDACGFAGYGLGEACFMFFLLEA